MDPAVNATTTSTGLTEGSHCSVCNEVLVKQEIIPIIFDKNTEENSNSNSGSGSGSNSDVDPGSASGSNNDIDVHEHIWDKGKTIKEVTCIENGVMIYTCEACGETKTDDIPPKGHTIIIDEAVEPTETATGLSEESHCSVCGAVMEKQKVLAKLEVKEGWIKKDGNWYLYSEGKALTGWRKKGNKLYYLDEKGIMQTGWKKFDGHWYYLNVTGAMQIGWKKISGTWYYFKKSGAMASNEWHGGYWLSVNGSWSYTAKGSWHKGSKGWWYGDTSGWYAEEAWYKIDGEWYYFDTEGYMVTGEITISDIVYTFDGNGAWIK